MPPLSQGRKSYRAFARAVAPIALLLSPAFATPNTPSFFWGAAFSAHQVEGGDDHSDWWDWEQIPGKIKNGETTARATDHYHRYTEDFDLARKLGFNSLRLSVAWSRIEPQPGVFDPQALEHYRNVVQALKDRGIEPVIALQHFVHPRWFHKKGGWLASDAPEIFARFARVVAGALTPQVQIWITFNEPMIQVIEGYLKGGYPPGIQDFAKARIAFRNLVRAHGLAAQAIRAEMQTHAQDLNPKLPISGVGLALSMNAFLPASMPGTTAVEEDRKAIATLSHLSQWAFLNAVQTGRLKWEIPAIPALPNGAQEDLVIPEAHQSLDWIGVNYYSRYLLARDPRNRLGVRWITPKEGLIDPKGLSMLLRETHQHLSGPIPIVVSENGIEDSTDSKRPDFIRSHIAEVAKVRHEGLDVRGYWYWSLTDNFEWQSGFGPRFGLVEIDYQSLERRIRPSAWVLHEIMTQNPDGPQFRSTVP